MTEIVLGVFAEACARFADRPALLTNDRPISYAQLAARVDEAAATLRREIGGVRAHVGIWSENRVEIVVAYYACLAADTVPFLIDTGFGPTEVEAIRDTCAVRWFVTADGGQGGGPKRFPVPEGCREAAAPDGLRLFHAPGAPEGPRVLDDTATCRFTSGSTGAPTALEFSDRAVVAAARSWAAGTEMSEDDVLVCVAGLANGLAFNTSLLATLLTGASVAFFGGLPTASAVQRAMTAHRATRLVGFPLLYEQLVRHPGLPDAVATLRHAISAGAPLAEVVRERFRERTGIAVSDYYGLAECGPCTYEAHPATDRGLGLALPGVDLRTTAPGDGPDDGPYGVLEVRTRSMASHCLNAPGRFEDRVHDGFYRTSDLAELREGRLHLHGRADSVVNRGGRKFDAAEVEAVLRGMPGVADAVVVQDARPDGSPVPVALLVCDAPLTRQEVLAGLRARVAAYKVPGHVLFVDEIQRTSIGKPVMPRQLLRESAGRQADPDPAHTLGGES